jgi:hypothetical protein
MLAFHMNVVESAPNHFWQNADGVELLSMPDFRRKLSMLATHVNVTVSGGTKMALNCSACLTSGGNGKNHFAAEFVSLWDLCSCLASLAMPLLATLLSHSRAAGKLFFAVDRARRPRLF